MRKKVDPAWHLRLQEAAKVKGLLHPVSDIARAIGTNRATVHVWWHGKAPQGPTYELLVPTCQFLQVTAAYLLHDEGPGPAASPLDGAREERRISISTAEPLNDEKWEHSARAPASREKFMLVKTQDADAYALQIRSDALFPVIRDSWIIVLEPNSTPTEGSLVLLETTDGGCTIKELLRRRRGQTTVASVTTGQRKTIPDDEILTLHRIGQFFLPD